MIDAVKATASRSIGLRMMPRLSRVMLFGFF